MKKQSVAAACVTALLLLTTACGKAEEPALPLPQEEQVKTICQLAVLECEYHNLAKYQDGQKVERFLWMTKGKRFWVEYSATAVLGIDADQVSMELQGDVVSITLPRARVLNCKVNGDSLSKDSYIVDKDSAPVTAQDEVAAFQAINADFSRCQNDNLLLRNVYCAKGKLVAVCIEDATLRELRKNV